MANASIPAGAIAEWVNAYYGAEKVSRRELADSLSGYFDRYTRHSYGFTKARAANKQRILDYAKRTGVPTEQDQYQGEILSDDNARTVNKALETLRTAATKWAWVDRNEEHLLSEVGDSRKGLDLSDLTSRPVFVYGGANKDILTDGYMLVRGHGSKKLLTDFANSKSGLRGLGATKSEVAKEIAHPSGTYPNIDALIPVKDHRTSELTVVGAGWSDAGHFNVFLTDGKGVMAVNADKLARIREMLPGAKMYGTVEIKRDLKRDANGDLVHDSNDRLVWNEAASSDLSPSSPISFVENGEVVGLLMPMQSIFPDIITGAVKKQSETKTIDGADPKLMLDLGGTEGLKSIPRNAKRVKKPAKVVINAGGDVGLIATSLVAMPGKGIQEAPAEFEVPGSLMGRGKKRSPADLKKAVDKWFDGGNAAVRNRPKRKEERNPIILYGGMPVRYSTALMDLERMAKASGEKDWMRLRDAGIMGIDSRLRLHPEDRLPDDVTPLSLAELDKVTEAVASHSVLPEEIQEKWITMYPEEERWRFGKKFGIKPKKRAHRNRTGITLGSTRK